MKRESKTIYALLGILSQYEMSGYEIKKFIETSLGFFWNESFGQIYPSLKKLEKNKFVSSEEVSSKENSKSKIVYKITKLGIGELKNWLEGETSKSTLRNEFLLKLFFARSLDKSILIDKIKLEEEIIKNQLKLYETINSNLKEHHKHPDYKYWIFTLEYGIEYSRMTLKWLNRIKKEMGK